MQLLLVFGIFTFLASTRGEKLTNREAYDALKNTINSVKNSCGEICDTTITGQPGKYFDEIKKVVNCPALFSNSDLDKPSRFEDPPMKIPKWLLDDYTYGGKVKLQYHYSDDSNQIISKPHYYNFSMSNFNIINERLDLGTMPGPYGKNSVDQIDRFLKEYLNVQDKHVLVIGSETPWIEVMALRNGAKHVTTLEYTPIPCEIPGITTILPEDFNQMFLEKSLPQFDLVISYSSVEHSGLGRYGDSLNPWGDLIAMARIWCILQDGGRALIGMPIGPDTVVFNLNRLYGPLMLPHLFSNFKQIYSEVDFAKWNPECHHCYQDLFVLEK